MQNKVQYVLKASISKIPYHTKPSNTVIALLLLISPTPASKKLSLSLPTQILRLLAPPPPQVRRLDRSTLLPPDAFVHLIGFHTFQKPQAFGLQGTSASVFSQASLRSFFYTLPSIRPFVCVETSCRLTAGCRQCR